MGKFSAEKRYGETSCWRRVITMWDWPYRRFKILPKKVVLLHPEERKLEEMDIRIGTSKRTEFFFPASLLPFRTGGWFGGWQYSCVPTPLLCLSEPQGSLVAPVLLNCPQPCQCESALLPCLGRRTWSVSGGQADTGQDSQHHRLPVRGAASPSRCVPICFLRCGFGFDPKPLSE